MDNSYILLLILKKGINVGDFIVWYHTFVANIHEVPKFSDYLDNNYHFFSALSLDEFEFNYFVSYLRLRGFLCQ